MAVQYKLKDGRDFDSVFALGNGGQTLNYKIQDGSDIGNRYVKGNSGIITGFRLANGVDIGTLCGKPVYCNSTKTTEKHKGQCCTPSTDPDHPNDKCSPTEYTDSNTRRATFNEPIPISGSSFSITGGSLSRYTSKKDCSKTRNSYFDIKHNIPQQETRFSITVNNTYTYNFIYKKVKVIFTYHWGTYYDGGADLNTIDSFPLGLLPISAKIR